MTKWIARFEHPETQVGCTAILVGSDLEVFDEDHSLLHCSSIIQSKKHATEFLKYNLGDITIVWEKD